VDEHIEAERQQFRAQQKALQELSCLHGREIISEEQARMEEDSAKRRDRDRGGGAEPARRQREKSPAPNSAGASKGEHVRHLLLVFIAEARAILTRTMRAHRRDHAPPDCVQPRHYGFGSRP
jgi:hypothetical protein